LEEEIKWEKDCHSYCSLETWGTKKFLSFFIHFHSFFVIFSFGVIHLWRPTVRTEISWHFHSKGVLLYQNIVAFVGDKSKNPIFWWTSFMNDPYCKIMKKQHRVNEKSHKELDGWNKEHSWLSTSYIIITNVLYSCWSTFAEGRQSGSSGTLTYWARIFIFSMKLQLCLIA
jgi:hypothetical protein